MSSSRFDPHAAELGRLLFERRQNPMAVFWIVMSVLFGGIGMLAFVSSLSSRKPDAVCTGVFFTGAAAAMALYVFFRSRMVLRCYEFGVVAKGWMGRRALRFDQTSVLAFEATRMRAHGIPLGTTFRFRIEPEAGAGGRPIVFRGALRKNDREIELLRETVSRAIAQRMGRQLIADGRAAWTRSLNLVAQGIEYRPLGLFGRKPPTVLPCEEIARMDIQDGWFSVWRGGRKLAQIRVRVSEPNFFPGYHLLLTLMEQKRKLATARS